MKLVLNAQARLIHDAVFDAFIWLRPDPVSRNLVVAHHCMGGRVTRADTLNVNKYPSRLTFVFEAFTYRG